MSNPRALTIACSLANALHTPQLLTHKHLIRCLRIACALHFVLVDMANILCLQLASKSLNRLAMLDSILSLILSMDI